MTTITIGRCVDDKMQQCNDNETMGTAQPAGRIRRLRQRVVGRIGVGVKGSQGGASGGRVGVELRTIDYAKKGQTLPLSKR